MNDAAMNIGVQVSKSLPSVLLDIYLEVGLWDCTGILYLIFEETPDFCI